MIPKTDVIEIFGKNDQFWTTSLDVAKKFEKRYDHVLRAIKNLDCSDNFRLLNLGESTRQTKAGEQKYYIISRDGFSFLAMGFIGKKAAEWKEKYIEAFNKMEATLKKILTQQSRIEWKNARTQSILPQRQKTDVIQKFIEYATAQGSKNASKYYLLIQEMEYNSLFEGGYKHLKLLSGYFNESKTLKDLFNINQLFTLINADRIAEKALTEGMALGMFYKDIFQLAKNRVLDFAALIVKDQILIGASSQN